MPLEWPLPLECPLPLVLMMSVSRWGARIERRRARIPLYIGRVYAGLGKVICVSDHNSSSISQPLPLGFRWSAVRAGIKASGKPDLALAACDSPAEAGVMYTSNQVVAAPITVGRRHLAATGGKVSAVIVNAGNANCATGEPGIEACHKSCVAVADAFGCVFDEIFPSSTGIIGVPLPVEKLVAAVPIAKAALGSGAESAEAFATAILTTDTKLKVAQESFVDRRQDSQPVWLREGCWDDWAAIGAACDDAGLYLHRPRGVLGTPYRDAGCGGEDKLRLHLD